MIYVPPKNVLAFKKALKVGDLICWRASFYTTEQPWQLVVRKTTDESPYESFTMWTQDDTFIENDFASYYATNQSQIGIIWYPCDPQPSKLDLLTISGKKPKWLTLSKKSL